MNQEQRDKLMRYLEAYLDGTLPAAQRAAFEDLLKRSEPLRRMVASQKSIDDSLKRQFEPPAAADVLGRILDHGHVAPSDAEAQSARNLLLAPLDAKRPAGVAAPRRRPFAGVRVLAVAASLVLAAGGVWMYWDSIRGLIGIQDSAPPGPPVPRTLSAIYQNEIDKGFKCQWECKTEEEFANTFRDKLGQALVMAPAPPDVQTLGLAYTTAITPQTVFLLAYVDKQPVIVFADRLKKDKPQPAPAPGLHLHRREVGTLVLYELTPFDTPRVSQLFKQP